MLGKLSEKAVSEMAHALEMPYDLGAKVRHCPRVHTQDVFAQGGPKIAAINKKLKDPMLKRDERASLMGRACEDKTEL